MPLSRKCSGLIVTSYNKNDNKNRLFKKRLAKSLKQYKSFKKNPKLEFDFSDRPEVKGNLMPS